MSVYLSCCVSGITSSTTTKIIAPAAKARAYGNKGVKNVTANAPITAAIGSTTADNCPYQKLLNLLTPDLLKA